MPDHLSPLGFQIKTVEAFEELAHMAVEYGHPHMSTHGSYVHWNWGQAIEFWTQADDTLQLTGCHPFFDSGRPIPGQLLEAHAEPDHPLDGIMVAQFDEDQRWVFQVPDFDRHHGISPNQRFALALFIHEITFLDDPTEASSYTPHHWPTEETPHVASTATLVAQIEHSTLDQNKISKGRFWHVGLKTPIGLVDAVCATGQMKKRPRTGAWVQINAWVTGRPLGQLESS